MRKVAYVFIVVSLLFIVPSHLFGQGTWRWDQKVLLDSEAKNLVGIEDPIPTSVSYQVNLTPPRHMNISADLNTSRFVTEDTVYTLVADVVGYKIESNDNDYHIVLMDTASKETMVAEIPKPDVLPTSGSSFVNLFKEARTSFEQMLAANHLPAPTTTLNGDTKGAQFKIRVKVVGVGFWDIYGHMSGGTMIGHGTGSAVSGREIHPILSIAEYSSSHQAPSSSPDNRSNSALNVPTPAPTTGATTANAMTTTPYIALAYILLASILGVAGQMIRVVLGLKKAADAAPPGTKTADIFSGTQFLISAGIAFIVGGVAGVLAAVTTQNYDVTTSTYFTYLAAGYAGTDLIEGFVIKR